MTKVVGVRFKDTGKTYYFDPKGLEIKKGDLVVVETARGMECGVAQYAPKEVAENEVTAPLKPVLRIATARDKQILEENKEKMEKAIRAEKLKKEAISDLQSEQQPETYKSRIEACREAILETGKAIFWQKCISRQPEKNDKEVNQMYEVQKELYVYLDSLEDLKHYAEKKKRIDAEIEKAEEEHAREAALYAQQKKEDALRNAVRRADRLLCKLLLHLCRRHRRLRPQLLRGL